jgi:hypothetical protein
MISIKKLEPGTTLHLILTSGFPLELVRVTPGRMEWQISDRQSGRKQMQTLTTSFLGRVTGNDLGTATLKMVGNAGSANGLSRGSMKGMGPAISAPAEIPWNYIKSAWKIERVAIVTKDPIMPERPTFGTNVTRERVTIP